MTSPSPVQLAPGTTFTFRVPGSIANLGPGFDTLAVAIELYLTLTARILPGQGELRFHFTGPEPTGVNLIAQAFHFLAGRHPELLPSLAVEVQSNIPMRAGLGSSAAATVAGLRLFAAASRLSLSTEDLLTAATALEGHPDNVAAALLGDLAISLQQTDGIVTAVSLPWPRSVELIVLTPQLELATSAARAVLPEKISRAHAIHNLQHTARLIWAISTGNTRHLREAMHDRLHQPYRQKLVPALAEALALKHPGLLGVCLSGAGPSLIALAEEPHIPAIRAALESTYAPTGIACTLRTLRAHSSRNPGDTTQ